MDIKDCIFYKTLNILADFADWDTTARLNHSLVAWCNHADSGFLPYETLLGKTKKIMMGVTSSLSCMRLSIVQVSHFHLLEEVIAKEFQEYDIYRYHYIVFSHSISLLQDLLFKLTSIIWSLNIKRRIIGWKELKSEQEKNNLTNILQILETFYKKFSKHIKKRNKFSHEGLLAYNSLDNFYMTYICTNLLVINESKNQQYIRGTQENIELLQETKEKFIKELNQLLLDAEQCVLELCDLCLEKLMSRIEHSFFQKNRRICNYLRLKRLYGLLEIWVTR